jgi:uncharacterized iron-regulated protein
MRIKILTAALVGLLTLGATLAVAEEKQLHQAIGDPERKDREVQIVLDGIVDTRSGELVTPEEMAARLRDARMLLIGESHTDVDFHRVQLRILQALVADGREVLIGLEMYPYTEQEHLDAWSSGEQSEQQFLDQSKWYEMWGYHWNYYRDIFLFARDNGIGMYAVNAPRDVVKAVRKRGFQDLTEEEAAHIPTEIETGNEEHRQLFKSFFDEDDPLHAGMSDEMWDGMINAQSTWDATMGYNAAKNLEAHGGDDAIMVILVGSGHVSYDLGIARQAQKWVDGRIASVIPISIVDGDGDPVDKVQASYADFLWGLPPARDPIYPVLGLSTRKIEEPEGEEHSNGPLSKVIHISEETVAEAVGFQLEDVLLAMDGVELRGKGTFNRLMAARRWGDVSVFTIERDGERMDLTVPLRRRHDAEADDCDEETEAGDEAANDDGHESSAAGDDATEEGR